MRVLITGAAGFLGRGLIQPFEHHGDTLRLMDIAPFESPHETCIGSVADLPTVRRAVDSMDAVVIAHMARNPDGYATPEQAFDINIKGMANLLFAAVEQKIRRIVLISSTGAAGPHTQPVPHTQPPRASGGLYPLTKCLQEIMAEYYAREHGLSIAALRIGYVVDGEALRDKYGRPISERPSLLTDRRDVGEVARRCLQRADIAYEVFNVMSTPESLSEWDVAHTCRRLDWKPAHDFRALPRPKA